jgi:hypothetical protein
MHALCKASRKKVIPLKPVALAVALALSNVGAFAASMQDVVSTRAAQRIGEQYGRDSLYAFSPALQTGQNPTNSSRLSRRGKSYGAGTSDKSASALRGSAPALDLLPAIRPEPYGRAGGYIGWERVVMMRLFPATLAGSAVQGPPIVKNGSGNGGDVADRRTNDAIYPRKPAAWSRGEVSPDSPAVSEGEGQSASGTSVSPQVGTQPDSGSAALPVSTALGFEDQLADLVRPTGDTSAMEHLSEGQEHPNTEARREPDPFTTEDHNSPTVRRESEGLGAADEGSGKQSDPVVRALPEQAPLRSDDEGQLNAEDHQFDSIPVDSSRDTSVANNASRDGTDPTMDIVVPLTAPSDEERESQADTSLREGGASIGQDTREIEITVSVVGEQ